jgi:hypothetical protein
MGILDGLGAEPRAGAIFNTNPREARTVRLQSCAIMPVGLRLVGGSLGEERAVSCGLEFGDQSLQAGLARSRRYAPSPRRRGRAPTRRNVMPEPSKQEIDARAYQLWEKAGRPEGREDEFWHLAQQELRNKDKSSPTRTPDAL